MSDELDLDGKERRLAELFAAVEAPESLRGRWTSREGRGRARRVAGRWLIGAPGERRLRPLAAALLVPVLALGAAAGFGVHARLATSGGAGPNPEARGAAAMAFDPVRGDVVMFGGSGRGGQLADTWTWDGSAWTQQHPSVSPPALASPALAADPASGNVLLVGGTADNGVSRAPFTAQTWSWDGSTWRELHPAHQPDWATFGSVATDPMRHQVVLVAEQSPVPAFVHGPPPVVRTPGANSPSIGSSTAVTITPVQQVMHTWTWDGTDWTLRDTPSGLHGFPGFHIAWDEKSQRVVDVNAAPVCAQAPGGSAGAPAIGRVFPPSPAVPPPSVAPIPTPGAGWSGYQPAPPPAPTSGPIRSIPAPTAGAVQVLPAPAPCLITGSSSASAPSGWAWDGSTWHAVPVVGTLPISPGVLIASEGTIWWARGNSSPQHPDQAPLSARSGPALAADAAHHVVVLFGGSVRGGLAADTWTWDGTAWTHRAGPTPPVPTPRSISPHPLPVAPSSPMSGSCSFGPPADVKPVGDVLVYSMPWPQGTCATEPLTVTLVDGAGNTLAVRGNPVTLSPSPVVSFTWTNWCGSGQTLLRLGMPNMAGESVITPPGCGNRSAPSILAVSAGHPGVHP